MVARQRRYPKEEFARRGDAWYEQIIRPSLEKEHEGKFVAIDIESGDYEIDADEMKACDRLYSRRSEAQPWMVRVGQDYLHRLFQTAFVPKERFRFKRCRQTATTCEMIHETLQATHR